VQKGLKAGCCFFVKLCVNADKVRFLLTILFDRVSYYKADQGSILESFFTHKTVNSTWATLFQASVFEETRFLSAVRFFAAKIATFRRTIDTARSGEWRHLLVHGEKRPV
jgi:hypothetical protein